MLHDYLETALKQQETVRRKYQLMCQGLAKYQEEYPFYFQTALEKINIDFESKNYLPEEKETYDVGDKINKKIKNFFSMGMERGEIRKDIKIEPTIFTFLKKAVENALTQIQ